MILIKFIIYWLKELIRQLYWLYRLSLIKGIKDAKVEFPIIVEGKGKVELDSDCLLSKNLSLKIAKGSTMCFGKSCTIMDGVDVRVGKNASLTTLDNCTLGTSSRLFINNHWSFGANANIATNCAIFSRETGLSGKLIMHDNSFIADNCIIDVADDIFIGKDVAIGPHCTFYTHDHEYTDLSLPAWNGNKTTGKISIGDKSWIGSNVTILPNVTVGQHAVVAAGSVVTKNIPDNTVWAGVPAKQIKSLG